MATKRRRSSAKGTFAKQEAARKRSAPGKRFVGETAAQSARDRAREREKVGRMARAARKAKRAEAARAVSARRSSARHGKRAPDRPEDAPSPLSGQSDAAFRAAEEDAAVAGAEVEPLAPVSRLVPRDAGEGWTDAPDGGAIAVGAEPDRWEEPYATDVSAEHGGSRADGPAPALGGAVTDLVRSALGLAWVLVSVPFRIALAVPRFALRAVMNA